MLPASTQTSFPHLPPSDKLAAGTAEVAVPPPWLLFHCPSGVAGLEAATSAAPAAQGSSGSSPAEGAGDDEAAGGRQEQGHEAEAGAGAEEQQQQREPQQQQRDQVQQREWLALQPPSNLPQLLWHVPVGNLDHSAAVAVATSAVSLACSGAIVWAALGAARAGAMRADRSKGKVL
jgi:hypothetical protein